MFTPSRAYCSKAGETKQMTEANNLIISLVFGTSRESQSEGSVSALPILGEHGTIRFFSDSMRTSWQCPAAPTFFNFLLTITDQ